MCCYQFNSAAYPTWLCPTWPFLFLCPRWTLWSSVWVPTSVGRVTSPSMPPAVTHRLAFTTWSVTRSQLLRLWWSSVPIPSTTCTPISRSLFASKQLEALGGHRHNTDWNGPSISPNTLWLVGGGGGNGCDAGQSAGLREGLLLGWQDYYDGGETREDSDCCFFGERGFDSSPCDGHCWCGRLWGRQLHCFGSGTGDLHENPRDRSSLKAWCETISHVKVERMDTFVGSGRGEFEGKN